MAMLPRPRPRAGPAHGWPPCPAQAASLLDLAASTGSRLAIDRRLHVAQAAIPLDKCSAQTRRGRAGRVRGGGAGAIRAGRQLTHGRDERVGLRTHPRRQTGHGQKSRGKREAGAHRGASGAPGF